MCVCEYVPQCARGGQGQLSGVISLSPTSGVWGSNSGHQALVANSFIPRAISLALFCDVYDTLKLCHCGTALIP